MTRIQPILWTLAALASLCTVAISGPTRNAQDAAAQELPKPPPAIQAPADQNLAGAEENSAGNALLQASKAADKTPTSSDNPTADNTTALPGQIPFANIDLNKLPGSIRTTRLKTPLAQPAAAPAPGLQESVYSGQLSRNSTETTAPIISPPQSLLTGATNPQTQQLPLPGPMGDDEEINLDPTFQGPGTTPRNQQLPSGNNFGNNLGLTPDTQSIPPIGPMTAPRTPAAQMFGVQDFIGPAVPQTIAPSIAPPISPAIANSAAHPAGCPCGCQPTCATLTMYVPVWETRYINRMETRYRPELRQKKYRTQHVVYDDVPKTEAYTVMVPQQRTRNFTVNQKEEIQVPVQENFTVMVPKPQQREVPFEREEEFQVPIEVPYEVMVPVKREKQITKYRTVIDKEPYQKRFVVEVPKERVRLETKYEKVAQPKTIRKPVTRMIEESRTRYKVEYVSEVRTRMVPEKYIEYVDVEEEKTVQKFRTVENVRQVPHRYIEYVDKSVPYRTFETIQRQQKEDKTINYKVAVPYTENAEETYYENVAYEEQITKTIPTKIQVPRSVAKTYNVKIPYTEHVTQNFNVNVEYQEMQTRFRNVTKQVPVTKYRTISRDMGSWKKEQCTSPTCSMFTDGCGCTTCCAGMQHTFKNVWCPKVVTQRIPYTDYQDVIRRIPYQVPVVKQKTETRSRKIPVTKYTTETRTANVKVMDYRDDTRTENFTVTKYRWVARTRPVTRKSVREESRQKSFPIVKYDTVEQPIESTHTFRDKRIVNEQVNEPYTERVPYTDTVKVKVTRPIEKTRMVPEKYLWREPVIRAEEYTVKVAKLEYEEIQETVYVEEPRVKEIVYTEMVPEFRTKTEYREVKREVPYYETETVTEMVKQLKTRKSFRTESRTVTDIKMETFMKMVPEIRTRTVYKTKYFDVPKTRTETYWENVPEKRYRTKMVRVPRTVQREHVQQYTVKVPYQVQVCIPQKICRMVPRTFTVPVEPVCDECGTNFSELNQVGGAYLNYGVQQLQSMWRRTGEGIVVGN